MDTKQTYYQILGVSRDAPAEIVSAAYRAQMLQLRKHPDLGGDAVEAAIINEAYEVLSDTERRRRYDASIADAQSQAADAAPPMEKRRAPRNDADAPVSFCLNHDNNWHSARITDYSALGVRMRSHTPLTEGERIVIAPPNLASFALHGTIKWARAFHPNVFERVYEAGIEFADCIDDIDRRLTT